MPDMRPQLSSLGRVCTAFVWITALAVSGRALAATGAWTGAAGSNWATAGNWTASPVPGTGDTGIFNGTGNGNTTISLGAGGVTVRGVSFDTANVVPFTIGAGAVGSEILTIDASGGLTLSSTVNADQTVNAVFRLATVTAAAVYTITNAASNAGGGRTLTLAGGITSAAGVSGPKTLTINSVRTGNNSSAVVAIPGIIGGGAGTLAITKTGAGRLELGGANTFTGILTIADGTLAVPSVNDSSTAGPLGNNASAVLLDGSLGSPVLAYTGTSSDVGTKRLSFNVSGTVSIEDAGGSLTLNGILDGDTLIKTGPGTLALGAANTLSGVTVSAGTLILGSSGNLGSSAALVVDSRLDLNNRAQTVSSLAGSGLIVNNGASSRELAVDKGGISVVGGVLVIDNPTSTYSGVLADNDNAGTGAISLRKTGSGTLELSGANTYSGATTVAAGSLLVSGIGTLGGSTAGTTVSNGATLQLSNAVVANEALAISGAGQVISGITITNGALEGYGTSTISSQVTLSTVATIYAATGANFSLNGNIALGASTLTMLADGAAAFGGVVGGTGALTKTGAGTLTLSGNNSFSGAFTIAAGTVSIPTINNASAAGPLGQSAGAVAFNQAASGDLPTLLYTGGTASSTKLFSTADLGIVDVSTAATNLSLNGVISGAGAFTKAGPGTLTLGGVNTYGGGTTVSAGTLRFSGSGRPGATTGSLALAGGGKLDLNNTTQTVGDISAAAGSVILNNGNAGASLTLTTSTTTSFLGTIIDNDNGGGGTVMLTKTGAGQLIFSNANTYTGSTTISDGTLTLTGSGTLGSSTLSTRVVANGATLLLSTPPANTILGPVLLNGSGDSAAGHIGALEGAGATFGGQITLGSNATIAATSGTFRVTFNGALTGALNATLFLTGSGNGELASALNLSGTGGLAKNGSGTWTLTGGGSYSGATSINAGVLNIQHATSLGNNTGATSITSGATLQLQGGITVANEGITLRGVGAAGTTGAMQNTGGSNTWGGPITLGAAATISVDAGSLTLTSALGGAFALTLAGTADGTITAGINTGAGTVTKVGTGTWTLSGTNGFTGALAVNQGVLLVPAVNNASVAGPLGNRAGSVTLGSSGLTGTLAYTGATAASNKPFTLGTGGEGDFRIDDLNAVLTLSGLVDGTGSLIKSGPGTLVLNNASNSYSGHTYVNAGTLTVAQATLANAADVFLASGATFNLAFSGTDTIDELFIDGQSQSGGTWGSPSSGATYRTSLLSGPGLLLVSTGPSLSAQPYVSWAAGQGLTGAAAAFTADPDNDGIGNGLEWILGGNGSTNNASTSLVQYSLDATDLILNFTRVDGSEGRATLTVMYGSDLQNVQSWNVLNIGSVSDSIPGGPSVTVVENGSSTDNITVRIPRNLSVNGKLFARLEAIQLTGSGSRPGR